MLIIGIQMVGLDRKEKNFMEYTADYIQFIAQGGTRAQWVQYLAMLNGTIDVQIQK